MGNDNKKQSHKESGKDGGGKKRQSGSGDSTSDSPVKHHVGRSQDEIASDVEKTVTDKAMKEKMLKNLDESQKTKEAYKKMRVTDYECLDVIGRGAFGEVMIARLKSSGQVFALKRMLKKDMVKKHQTQHIRAERDVLALADNPWIVKLHYSFQDNTWLYLAMEFLQGGDLMTILIKKDILSHQETAFYMAELCMAVDSVHKLNYIHRDLKPDNILFDSQGHLKLSDFGLCKQFDTTDYNLMEEEDNVKLDGKITIKGRSYEEKTKDWKVDRRKLAHSMVGTPDYMAPEIFTQQGYGKEVDWWSIGVIMYECLVGYAPFYGDRPVESARKIVKFEDHFLFPVEIDLTAAAEDLMNKLVSRAPKRKKFISNFENIKRHPFFRDLDWDNLRTMKAVNVPKLKDETDAACFDQFEQMEVPETTGHDQGEGKFVGYTYKQVEDTRKMGNNAFSAPTEEELENDEGDDEEHDN